MKKSLALLLLLALFSFSQTACDFLEDSTTKAQGNDEEDKAQSGDSKIGSAVVEAKGIGKTREAAINAALVEAVSKVHGVTIESKVVPSDFVSIETISTPDGIISKILAFFGLSDLLGQGEEASSGDVEKSRQILFTSTAGMVQGYDVISEESSSDGVEIVLSVRVAEYKESAIAKRKRIATLPFRVSQDSAVEFEFVEFLGTEVIDFLTQTQRFAILDRDYLAEKETEFDFIAQDNVKVEEKARLANTLGTDYILTGTVISINKKTEVKEVPYTNRVTESTTISSSLSWRLIEVATGQVILSDTTDFESRSGKGSANSKDDFSQDKWLRIPAAVMGERIAREIMDFVYPLMPIAYKNGRLTIPQGGETVQTGQEYTLIQQGDMIFDPYTKEAVGREELGVGTVKIIQVAPKISYAEIVKSSLTETELSTLKENQYIMRPLSAEYKNQLSNDLKAKEAKQQETQTPAW